MVMMAKFYRLELIYIDYATKHGRRKEEWTKALAVTVPKNGDLALCSKHRNLSLINHMRKILLMIIQNRLKTKVEPFLSDEQAGF